MGYLNCNSVESLFLSKVKKKKLKSVYSSNKKLKYNIINWEVK